MQKQSSLTVFSKKNLAQYLRKIIATFFCTLLLVGVIPPPLLTHLAPTPLEPLAKTAANLLPEPAVAMAQNNNCNSTEDLGGTVWNDVYINGKKDTHEVGVDGTTAPMTVEAHDRHHNVVTASVSITGTYLFDGIFNGVSGDDAKFRLEFKGMPAGYAYSIHGDDNGTAVQFHSAPSCDADMALHVPDTSCNPVAGALATDYNMVMTCGADHITDTVMALKDVSGLSYSSSNQTPAGFSHPNWTLADIGNIFFTEFDDKGNIYGTASAFAQQDVWPRDNTVLNQYGALGGPGAVYKFDAITGNPTVFVTLTQEISSTTYSGLGGIAHDPDTDSMYVVNMFDNTIYRLNDTTGAVIDSYQPSPATLGTASGTTSSGDDITDFQAVPFGVDVYDGRLYYTVHDATDGGSLVVRSVGLASDGKMSGTDKLEKRQVIPNSFTLASSTEEFQSDPVVADIDFSPVGQMAVSTFSSGPTVRGTDQDRDGGSPAIHERSYYAEGHKNSIYNHSGPSFIFNPDGVGGWTQSAITSVGQETFSNILNSTSTGGIAWSLDPVNPDTLWMSGGDFNGANSQWGIIGYDSTQLDNIYDQENATNYIQFLFEPQSKPDPKGNGGDVDIFCIPPPMEVGNYLWADNDDDKIQDPDELGIPSIVITITPPSSIPFTVTTNANGEYYFPAEPNATYDITIDTNQPGLAVTTLTFPDTNSSNPIRTFAITTAGPGNNDHTKDFGFTPKVSIGSTLFYDYNDNGLQDANESGIPNIRVELHDDQGMLNATTTDVNGDYYFGDLYERDYQIVIPNPPVDAPTSSTPTDPNDNQEDGDDNGSQPGGAGTIVSSPIISLTVDGEPIGEAIQGGDQDDVDDNNGDMTVDFGFVPHVSLGSTLFYDPNDNGIQDIGETGIPTIVVELRDITGTVVASTTTNINGDYFFDQLLVGQYQVVIPTPPGGAPLSSTPNGTLDDDVDSDDNGSQPGGLGTIVSSPVITLTMNGEPTGETGQGGTQDAADDNNGNMTVDFGFRPLVSVGSTLFYDPNNNGEQDGNEDGIPGVVVELHSITGTVLMSDTTDANGDYYFGDLFPGPYQVVIPTPPANAPESSTPTDTADNQEDGDDNGSQTGGPGTVVKSPIITLTVDGEPTGEIKQGGDQDSVDDDNGDMTVDFGFIPNGSLGSTLFYDNNNNGVQDGGETGIAGIVVQLRDPAGNVIKTTTTNSAGNYYFDGLPSDLYQIVIPMPPSNAPTSSTPTDMADNQQDGDDNGIQSSVGGIVSSPVISLTIGGEPTGETGPGGNQDVIDDSSGDMTIDFGFAPYVSIGSTLFYDPNDNGLQDGGETGIAGITVELYNSAGYIVRSTTTNSSGDYYFGSLLPGAYRVVIPTPPGDAPTSSTPTDTADNRQDSDDNGSQPGGSGGRVTSPLITLTANGEPTGETGQGGSQDSADDNNGDMTIDFGFVPHVSIGSTIFYDPNDNGLQESGEIGIPGVVVELHDINGNTLLTTTTDSDGNYYFGELLEDQYQVVIPTPPSDAPNSSTPTDLADNQEDSDDNGDQPDGAGGIVSSPVITLTVNGEPASESGQGGGQDSADDNNGDMTVDFGFVPYVSLGSTLFYDPNDNGFQDPGETGIAGVPVELRDTAGNLVASTVTNGNGDYYFGELYPGDYQVVIPTPPADAPTSSTPTDLADNQEDGDDNGNQPAGSGGAVTSPVITLTMDGEPVGESGPGGSQDGADDNNGDMTVDFGFVPYVSLGSTLFYDDDDSGTQDGGELGIPNITVELYNSVGVQVATTTTDGNGDYYFGGLLAGEYQVVIPTPPADAPTSSTPTDLADNQEDGDDNGDQPAGSGGRVTSPMIMLTVDGEPATETAQGGDQDNADDNNGDMTVDFGFVRHVSLGSTLFYDLDDSGTQDVGETGIAGITVELYDAAGNLVTSTTTDGNGDYYFGDLLPGDYQVVIPTPPTDAPVSSTFTNVDDDNVDGDDNGEQPAGSGGRVTSPMITLSVDGEPTSEAAQGGDQDIADDDNGDMTVDFGFIADVPDTPVPNTPVPNTPIPNTPIPDTPIPDTPIPDTPVPNTPVPNTPVPNTPTPNTPIPDTPVPDTLVPDMSIGSTLFYDDNDSGTQDVGEAGISDITVQLYDSNGDLVASTTTDQNGNYYFGELSPGDYQVVIPTPPADAPTSSTPTDLTDNQEDGDDNGIQLMGTGGSVASPMITLSVGDEPMGESGQGGDQDSGDDRNGDMTVDFGFVRHVSIGSTLFYDPNDNGLQDAGETGIPGIAVELRDDEGTTVKTTTTDSDGNYLFDELLAGQYQVVIPTPPTDAPTNSTPINSDDDNVDSDDNGDQPDGSGGPVYSPIVDLSPDEETVDESGQGGDQDADDDNGDMTIDFGFVPLVSLGSTLFYDDDNSGTQDAGEVGIPGIIVELYDTADNLIATTTTDANGDYYFGDLLAGEYQVVIPTPPTDAPMSSTPTNDNDDGIDGDDNGDQPDGAGGAVTSPVITLNVGEEATGEPGQGGDQDDGADSNGDMTVDFGFVRQVSIGSTIFYDSDDSGTQDVGEVGIPGITVELHDTAGNVVATTMTNGRGDYYFGRLLAGEYQVVIPTPPTHAPTSSTPTDLADNQEDGDDNGHQPDGPGGVVTSPIITLAVNGEPTNEAAQGGDQDDADDDTDDDNGDMTVDFGFIPEISSLDTPMPYVSIGSTLFYDEDDSGTQDEGEAGIPDIMVALYDSDGNLVASTTTDQNGDYYFGGLLAGEYQVVIPTPPADAPTSSTPTDSADNQEDGDDNGSQPDGSGGVVTSPMITLAIDGEPTSEPTQGGEQDDADDDNGDMTVDFGFIPNMSIGSTIFYDDDDSGTQDEDEVGISGIDLELRDDEGTVVMTTTTDADGNYLFDGLYEGDYQIVIPAPPVDASTSSSASNLEDDSVDSDDNGDQPDGPGGVVTSPVIDLTPDEETIDEPGQGGDQDAADDDNGDMTVDFGFVPDDSNLPDLSIGSTIFYDEDDSGTQDEDEVGIPGIDLELHDDEGTVVMTTTTDVDGNYLFDELYEGYYQIVIPAPPVDAPINSSVSNLEDDSVDGDDNGDQPDGPGGPVTSPLIGLAPDEETTNESGPGGDQDAADDDNGDMTIDFGFVPPVSLGSTLFYDEDNSGTQDAGEAGVPGIIVELYDTAGNLIATTTTDANGDYYFGNLLAGEYQVVVPAPPADAAMSSIPTNDNDDGVDGDDNGHQPDGPGGPLLSPIITLGLGEEPADEPGQGGDQDDAADNNGDMTVDFGLIRPVSLGSTLFYDLDDSGTQDVGEAGIPDLIVELYDSAGKLVASTTTDENGDYYFGGLLPGVYQVVIPAPPADALNSSTSTNSNDDGVDGDDNGDQPDGAGGAVWSPFITLTVDGEGINEPGPGGEQDASDDNNGDMTVDFGFVPPVSVGNLVWYDDDGDGRQGDGETGVSDVTVHLFNSNGTPATDMNGEPVPAQVTDKQGEYLFTNLPPGSYYAVYDPTTLPDGYTITTLDSGDDDGTDSDGDPETGQTAPTGFLPGGSTDLTLDLGIQPILGSTTNLLWFDRNGNDVQDEGETGLSGITVFLNQGGVVIGQTTTDEEGRYTFDDLTLGSYYITFTPPQDLETVTAVGSNIIGLTQGPDITIEGSGNVSVLDIGFTEPVVLGGYVWIDENNNGLADEGESGYPGAVVHLLDLTGNILETTATDSEGNLDFEVLPNDYQLQFILPGGVEFTQPLRGADNAIGSDVDPVTGLIQVLSLQENLELSAGLVPLAPTGLRLVSLAAREIAAGVSVEWGTRLDSTTFGFEVYRSNDSDFENAVAVTDGVILTGNEDDIYTFIDTAVQVGEIYTYWIVERLQNQQTNHYGPVGIVTEGRRQVFLPLVQR